MQSPSSEPSEHSPVSQNGIDFSKPPLSIQEYRLGNPISRENFTHFLIDSFAKSRGNPDLQTYYWMWLQKNTGQNVNGIVHNFIDFQGNSTLADGEQDTIKSFFDRIRQHTSKSGEYSEGEEETSFGPSVNQQIRNGLYIWDNPGQIWKRGSIESVIQEPDKDVLRMGKAQFEEWLRPNTNREGLFKEVVKVA